MTRASPDAAAWTRQQAFLSRRATGAAVLIGLAGSAAAVGQAWCIAVLVSGSGALPWLAALALLALGGHTPNLPGRD